MHTSDILTVIFLSLGVRVPIDEVVPCQKFKDRVFFKVNFQPLKCKYLEVTEFPMLHLRSDQKCLKKRQYAKEAMDEALKFVNNGGSKRIAARMFGVPRSSIQFKCKNPDSKFRSGPDPVLTECEENALCEHIIQMSKRGFPRKKEDIQLCVQDFLKANPRPNPFRDNKPGDAWFKAFLNRHPNITIRTAEGVTNASACVSEEDIRKWFREIAEYINKEGLTEVIEDPTRVFNADETGFNICPSSGKVLAEKGTKNVYQIEKGSAKENITVLFTFSADGLVCKPMIIYPYKRIPDRVSLSVPAGWGIGRSDSGWMTASVFHDFIANCFYEQLVVNEIALPVILFVDGHKTHITMEVSELCRSLKIHLIALYPNATRILQPADVAAFRPIKAGWKKGLREWYAANYYEKTLSKESFAPLLKNVIEGSIKKETLVNGFRVTGLFPFDANNVDYSKCLASSRQKHQSTEIYTESDMNVLSKQNHKSTETDAEINMNVLTYQEFCDIIGESILVKCQTATALTVDTSDENFNAIWKLWQIYNKCDKKNIDEDNLSVSILNDCVNDVNEEPRWTLDEHTGELKPVQENEKERKEIDAKLETEKEESYLEKRSAEILMSEYAHKNNADEELDGHKSILHRDANEDKEESYIEKSSTEIVVSKYTQKNKEDEELDGQNTISDNGTNNKNDKVQSLTNKTTPQDDQYNHIYLGPSTSTGRNSRIQITSNISLQEYLMKKNRPASPKRLRKRQMEKLPFALTSNCYVEMIKAKQLKKQQQEAAKEERKRLRDEKKHQKENNIPKKKPKQTINKSKGENKKIVRSERAQRKFAAGKKPNVICCDACLCPITRRVLECSQCNNKYHQNCIPTFHRMHIPEDNDDGFLCHICYRESNTDSSDADGDYDMYNDVLVEARKQGF